MLQKTSAMRKIRAFRSNTFIAVLLVETDSQSRSCIKITSHRTPGVLKKITTVSANANRLLLIRHLLSPKRRR